MNVFTACMLSTKKQAICYVYEDVSVLFAIVKRARYQLAVRESEIPGRYTFQIFRVLPAEDGERTAKEQRIAEYAHVSLNLTTDQLKEFLAQHAIELDDWQPDEREIKEDE